MARKAALLREAAALELPGAPLDRLIDGLGGPSKVAEMTGRRGRVVRIGEGDRFRYQVRSTGIGSGGGARDLDNLNVEEKKLFMDGKKDAAIISDAASTGKYKEKHQRCLPRAPR